VKGLGRGKGSVITHILSVGGGRGVERVVLGGGESSSLIVSR